MFATAVLTHTIKLRAREVGANVREVVEDRARSLLEGVCGEHGYVRPSSLRMMHMSPGLLGDIDMGKSYSFTARFKVEVCNPVRGLRFNALVRSINRFGMLCEGGYYDPDNSMVPVIEVVVVRNPATIPNEVELTDLQIGDEVGVEVLGRNFELRDSRISAFGRTVRDAGETPVLSGGAEPEAAEEAVEAFVADDAGSAVDSDAGSEAAASELAEEELAEEAFDGGDDTDQSDEDES